MREKVTTQPQDHKLGGFTLLEILVVMTILGILAVIVVPRLADRPKEARRLKAVLQIRAFQDALEQYYVDYGSYPSTQEGLTKLVEKGAGAGKRYLDSDRIPKDPWKGEYVYLCPGLERRPFDIVSFGQDGKRGGDGWNADIESWNLDE